MLLPSSPSSTSRSHGQIPKRSAFGQGMCQNVRIVARGRCSWIILGASAK